MDNPVVVNTIEVVDGAVIKNVFSEETKLQIRQKFIWHN